MLAKLVNRTDICHEISHLGISFLMGVALNHHPFLDGIFYYKPSSYWGTPMAMETSICQHLLGQNGTPCPARRWDRFLMQLGNPHHQVPVGGPKLGSSVDAEPSRSPASGRVPKMLGHRSYHISTCKVCIYLFLIEDPISKYSYE